MNFGTLSVLLVPESRVRFEDSAIILRRSQSSGSYDGQAFTEDHRCSSVWLRRRGAWQLAWEHCSQIAP